jgi:hypothetical protein
MNDEDEEDEEEDDSTNGHENIEKLIRQLVTPNFNLLEKHLQSKKNHDLFAT